MADWFWKRKSKDQTGPTFDESTFTSYLEQEEGFVVVSKPTPGLPPVENNVPDYESLYQFRRMSLNGSQTNPVPTLNAAPVFSPSDQQPVLNVLPYQQPRAEAAAANDSSSFLDGIPFRVSNDFFALDTVRQIERESYLFLRQKTELLERLNYNFNLENEVLKEAAS